MYRIHLSFSSTLHQVKTVSSSEHLIVTIDNLREGKPYLLRVFAENEVGAGPAYELPEPIVPRAHMGKYMHYYMTPERVVWKTF